VTMRYISAAFDTRADAESAQQELLGMGVSRYETHILEQRVRKELSAPVGSTYVGLWTRARRMLLPEAGREPREAEIRRSAFQLTASVDHRLVDAVIITLLAADAVDVDEHQRQWRKNIWRGSAAAQAAIGMNALPASAAAEKPHEFP